jgi:hypothetical protein
MFEAVTDSGAWFLTAISSDIEVRIIGHNIVDGRGESQQA